MYKLWLDDERNEPSGWVRVSNYDEFKNYISSMGNPKEMSLDHDLGSRTGLECVEWYLQWLIDTEQKCCKIVTIHSMNPVGTLNMIYRFDDHRKMTNDRFKVYKKPFGGNVSKIVTKKIY